MKNTKILKHLLIILLLITNLNVIGNSDEDDSKRNRIRGVIIDETSQVPLEFANVAVYSKPDSALVTGTITNEKGFFEVTGLSTGEFYIEANFIGFNPATIEEIVIDEDSRTIDVGRIRISPSTFEIGGVDVIADRSQFEFKLDKKVVNVSQVISAIGGTAVDVLENTPSVQVDIEGNVSVRGSSNFTVLIDGRPSVLSGSEALRQVPSSALESIEIITNPSAKYEPDGMAGIINLITRKNSLNGFSGIVNGTIGTGDKYRGDITLDYRTEKFKITAGANWRDEMNFGSMSSRRETLSNDTLSYLNIDGSRNFNRKGHTFKSGIDWYLSPNSTLSLSGEVGRSENIQTRNGETSRYTFPATLNLFSVTEGLAERINDFYSINLNFQHNFNAEGHKIEAMAFYSAEVGSDTEQESEIIADEQFQRTNQYLERVFTFESEEENEYRLKLDYTFPFSSTGRIEAGTLSRLDRETEELKFEIFDEETADWIIHDNFSSVTHFKRDIHAAYTTFSSSLGKLDFMAGLRGELTIREIENTNFDDAATLNRFDLFPTVHTSYKIGSNSELMASYSRRINRPGGRDLDPNPSYFNRYTIRIGNPNLLPEFTDSYELGALRRFGRSYISLDGFHRITNNKIDRYETFEDGIFILRADNFDRDFSTGVDITGNISLTNWLMVNATASMYRYRITGDFAGEAFDRESTNWNGRMNTTLRFSDNSRLQVNGFYRGPSVSAQGESKAMFFTSLSYRHDFFNNKLTATASIRDPLGTAQFERESYGPDFNSWFRWKREPRVVMLTLSYRINNFRDNRNDREGSGGGMDNGGGDGEY